MDAGRLLILAEPTRVGQPRKRAENRVNSHPLHI